MRPGFSGSIAPVSPACWRARLSRTWRQGQPPSFVERKIEINEEDLPAIIEEYLLAHGDFEFEEIEIVNNRPMNIWLHAKCRKYIDTDVSAEEQQDQISQAQAEVEVSGEYDGNE